MKLDSDDFELFGVERRFAIDREALDTRRRALQGEVHPDRHATAGPAAQRVAMQWAVRINQAYRRLKDPLQRAAYLCELNGASIDAESNTAMPAAFLTRQLEWREALDDADALADVEALAADVNDERAAAFAKLAETIDRDRNFAAASEQVRALMFIERFAGDVEARRQALDAVAG